MLSRGKLSHCYALHPTDTSLPIHYVQFSATTHLVTDLQTFDSNLPEFSIVDTLLSELNYSDTTFERALQTLEEVKSLWQKLPSGNQIDRVVHL